MGTEPATSSIAVRVINRWTDSQFDNLLFFIKEMSTLASSKLVKKTCKKWWFILNIINYFIYKFVKGFVLLLMIDNKFNKYNKQNLQKNIKKNDMTPFEN